MAEQPSPDRFDAEGHSIATGHKIGAGLRQREPVSDPRDIAEGPWKQATAGDVVSGMISEVESRVKRVEPKFENADHLEANLNTLILNSNAARAANQPETVHDAELARQRRISEAVVAVVSDEAPPQVDSDPPDLGLDDDEPEPEDDNGVYGWHDDAEGVWYATDKDGNFLKDANNKWMTYADVVPEDELNEGDEVVGYLEETNDEEEYDDDAA